MRLSQKSFIVIAREKRPKQSPGDGFETALSL